uniref:Tissue factor pathway inhibitor n=1 Tax=Molossus molossus TaxID=27622 RepID=A0A7J8HEU2_MOLMO|nr:tissue factor pathway inhibitor 2 [Molossus molossus]
MDPTCTLRLLLLPLLVVGTAPGDAAQGRLGNNAEICLLPPDEGPCRARIPSFYYSRYTQSCHQFMYGGCEGNANNFETREACEEACWRIEKVPKICRLEVSEGQCGEPREAYFFNLSSMTCEQFMSGGCHHNSNQFPDEATCRDFCAPRKRKYYFYGPSYCYSPRDEGLCSANVTRYYFNPRHGACETFTYTGCGGNNNNFLSMKDCKRICIKGASRKKLRKKMPKLFFPGRRLKLQKKQF